MNIAVKESLDDPNKLEKVASIYRGFGKTEAARKIIEIIIRLHGATVTACRQYLDDLLKKRLWDTYSDDAFRGVLEQARTLGLSSDDFVLYSAYRALKKGHTQDALSSLFELRNASTKASNLVSTLIRAAYFKSGAFFKICQMDDSEYDMFYCWALWVVSPERQFSDNLRLELPEIVWNVLNENEIEVVKTFNKVYQGKSSEIVTAFRQES